MIPDRLEYKKKTDSHVNHNTTSMLIGFRSNSRRRFLGWLILVMAGTFIGSVLYFICPKIIVLPALDSRDLIDVSPYLDLSIASRSPEDSSQIIIRLHNHSQQAFTICVNTSYFEGVLHVSDGDHWFEVYDKVYFGVKLHGAGGSTNVKLGPDESIEWRLKIAELVRRDMQEVDSAEILTSSVYAEFERLAIVPLYGSYSVRNARLQSGVVELGLHE